MRLFIAINFSPKIKAYLMDTMNDLKDNGVLGNYTKIENLHLTLAFIGEVNTAEPIKRIMDGFSFKKFSIKLKNSGNFRDILWAGIDDNIHLKKLAYLLQDKLRENGYDIEKRSFKPHITLVRQADKIIKPSVFEASMPVEYISLMKSERINGRLTYTEIHRSYPKGVNGNNE